jgi:hypothetical protein
MGRMYWNDFRRRGEQPIWSDLFPVRKSLDSWMDSRLMSNYKNTLILAQAHAPTKLIAMAPSTTHEQAPTRRKPRSVLQLLSLRKSTTRSSVSEA